MHLRGLVITATIGCLLTELDIIAASRVNRRTPSSCNPASPVTDLVVVFASARQISTEAEVADLGVLSGDQQNVPRCQVAVYDTVAVEVSHPLGNLVH